MNIYELPWTAAQGAIQEGIDFASGTQFQPNLRQMRGVAGHLAQQAANRLISETMRRVVPPFPPVVYGRFLGFGL